MNSTPGQAVTGPSLTKEERLMAAKETVRSKLDKLRGRSARGETVSLDASALLRFADGGVHFLLAAVLAGAAIFGEYAPFGVALVGAA